MTQTVVQHLQFKCRPQALPRARKDARGKPRPQLRESCFHSFSDATQQRLMFFASFGARQQQHAIFLQQFVLQTGTPVATISHTHAATGDRLHQRGGGLAVIPIAGRQNGINDQPAPTHQQMQHGSRRTSPSRFSQSRRPLLSARRRGSDGSADT